MNRSSKRLDLSNWVTHFVHSNDSTNAPILQNDFDLTYVPDYHQFKDSIERQARFYERCERGLEEDDDESLHYIYPLYSVWKDFEQDEEPLPPNSPPLSVLKKIIQTGYIRAGWSFRSNVRTGIGKPTIYGYRAACCFTEMPLYALIDYARNRSNKSLVSPYGIAFDRQELFAAGARSVIYGLTTPHLEEQNSDGWPRILKAECGVGPLEQFRYVATALDGRIDWTHEREWRWPLDAERCECPGLPIFVDSSPSYFSSVLIFVPTKAEGDTILDLLKRMFDSESFNMGNWYYDLKLIQNTRVISIEEIRTFIGEKNLQQIRLEDIPFQSIRRFSSPIPSESTLAKTRIALSEARVAAQKAGNHYRWQYPDNTHECFWDQFGWAFIRCTSSQSEFLAALKVLEAEEDLRLTITSECGYQIEGVAPRSAVTRGTLKEGLAVAEAIVKVFKQHFPDVEFTIAEHLN